MHRFSTVIVLGNLVLGCCPRPDRISHSEEPRVAPIIRSKGPIEFPVGDGTYMLRTTYILLADNTCTHDRVRYENFFNGPVRFVIFIPNEINELVRCRYEVRRRLLRPESDPLDAGYYTNIYYMLPERSGSCMAPASRLHFVEWEVEVPEQEPDAKDGVLCPKIIYAGKNVREQMLKESCYSIAGFNSDALVPCWKTEERETLYYLPDNTDGLGPERMGCMSLSPKHYMGRKSVKFVFYTDRLAAFRLLPATDEERARVRDWRKPGSTFVSPDGICEVVPDSSRLAFRFTGYKEDVFGRLICRDDNDCREGQSCEKYEKSCRPDLGLCREVPAAGPEN